MGQLLALPTAPFRGFRGLDAWGSGAFGASRTKAGKSYAHKGLDICTVAGVDVVVALMTSRVAQVGFAYPDDPTTPSDERVLGTIHLEGLGEWDGLLAKLMYLRAGREYGERVRQGDYLGVAGDRARFAAEAAAVNPNLPRGPMTNHLHVELYRRERNMWVLIDPTPYFAPAEVV